MRASLAVAFVIVAAIMDRSPRGARTARSAPDRSSYAFVTRIDSGLDLESLDDPRLRWLRIGVSGCDGAATPIARALVARGIVDNVAVLGDPAAALAAHAIDVAIVSRPAPRSPF